MTVDAELEPLSDALRALPVRISRATGSRWLDTHPGLGLRIGGRCYLWREAREAIGRGAPLDQAAQIGRLAKERYFSARS